MKKFLNLLLSPRRTIGFSAEYVVNHSKCKNYKKVEKSCGIKELDQIKISIHAIDSSILDAKYIASIADSTEYVNRLISSTIVLMPNIPGSIIIEPSQPAAKFESTEEMIFFWLTDNLNLDIEYHSNLSGMVFPAVFIKSEEFPQPD